MTLYSNNCPKCKEVKSVLISKAISFKEIKNINEIMEKAKENNISTLPILEVDDTYYGGNEAKEKAKEL